MVLHCCSQIVVKAPYRPKVYQQANQFYGLKLAFATSVATNVAFAFAREKLALGSGGSGWVVHGRLHSLLSPFAHGYFMGKMV